MKLKTLIKHLPIKRIQGTSLEIGSAVNITVTHYTLKAQATASATPTQQQQQPEPKLIKTKEKDED